MDSPQEKAGSALDGKGETPHLLPVSVSVIVAKKATASRPTLFPDAVRLVSIWALFTPCFFFGISALASAIGYVLYHCGLQCVLDDDDWIHTMYCAAPQAAPAALALLLPCRHRRVRRVLACLALAVTTVGQYIILTGAVRTALALNPEAEPYLMYLFAMVSCTLGTIFFASGDLMSFLALLLAPGGED